MNELLDFVSNYAIAVPFIAFIVCITVLSVSILSMGIDHDVHMPAEIFGVENPLVTAGLSKIPLMIGLTLTFAPMTIMALILEQTVYALLKVIPGFGIYLYYLFATIGFLITFVASLFIAGFLSRPIEKMINNSHLQVSYEFKTGKVNSEKITDEYGEIRLMINDSEHFLSVVLAPNAEEAVYGDNVIVKGQREDGKYIVEKVQISS